MGRARLSGYSASRRLGRRSSGSIAGPYVSKEAAFEAAVGPAMNAIRLGDEVRVMVPGREGESALGTRAR
jgi:hypothetical protein